MQPLYKSISVNKKTKRRISFSKYQYHYCSIICLSLLLLLLIFNLCIFNYLVSVVGFFFFLVSIVSTLTFSIPFSFNREWIYASTSSRTSP